MFFTVARIVFLIVAIVGATFVMPISVAAACGEYSCILPFAIPMVCSLVLGVLFFVLGIKKKATLSTRAGFVVVALAWFVVSLFGSIPLYTSGACPRFIDAFFESVSGFTTTGATVICDVESLPRCINLWRCQMHWLGGMGIVALTVALLPILGVGGFQLIKNETTGPEKGKFTPKIATTSKILWFIYFGMTVVETILLRIAGMDFVDALSHSFSTLGTGGFSTKNSSIAYYDSVSIDLICSVFMFLAGINFSLYYYIFTKKFSEITDNSELKAYVGIVFTAIFITTLFELKKYGGFFTSLRYTSFQVLSLVSTTGFSTSDYTLWSYASQLIIFVLFFIGGSSGSTAGGVKTVRWLILAKQLHNEILRMIHPHGVFSIKLNKRAGRKDVVFNVSAFFFIFFALVFLTTFIGCAFGLDLLTSFSGSLTMVGNFGPGFNLLGPSNNCGFLCDPIKVWYCIVMVAGRLEFFTMAVFFCPSFWKK